MKRKAFPISILLLILTFTNLSCRTGATKTTQTPEPMNDIPVNERNNQFAFDIFKFLSQEHEDNMIISPFSISTAMAMTYAGARGETAREMSQTLHFDPAQERFHTAFHNWMDAIHTKGEKKNQLKIANSLWPQQDYHFVPEYFDLINKFYRSALYEVDYTGDREAIRQRINQWVMDHTNDLIKDLIAPGVLVEDTRLVLVNAIYFLSQWKIAFDKNATYNDRFNITAERHVQTPFMFMKDHFRYIENSNYQALELPYEGDHFSMVVVLPSRNTTLDRFVSEMQTELFEEINEGMQSKEVEVYLPSFTSRSKFDLENIMASMGMPLAFTNKANFSGMTRKDDLKIDKIIHEAYIDVNEEGTEAAASTAVVIIRKTAIADEPKTIFRANRPFFYFIKENSQNSILFMGKVTNPTQKD